MANSAIAARKYYSRYMSILCIYFITNFDPKSFEIDSISLCQNTKFKKLNSDADRGVDCKLHLKIRSSTA